MVAALDDVQRWGEEQEGLNGALAVNLSKRLYEEGYIYLNFLDTNIDRYPWFRAALQSLST
jgi:hypothetical protein